MTLKQKATNELNSMALTGADVRRLMRKYKVTIRDLAKRMQVTLKQVRKYRNDDNLLTDHSAACVYEWITGSRRIYLLYCAMAGNLPMQK